MYARAEREHATTWYLTALTVLWDAAAAVGVDPVVQAAQCAHETGWGHFGGVIDASFNNTCGMKTTKGGPDDDPAAHARFPDLPTGALAHAQHLHRYATTAPLPAGMPIVDPRYRLVTPGQAPTVAHLDGWAHPGYGNLIAGVYRRLVA